LAVRSGKLFRSFLSLSCSFFSSPLSLLYLLLSCRRQIHLDLDRFIHHVVQGGRFSFAQKQSELIVEGLSILKLSSTRRRFELGRNGIVDFHESVREFLDRFTLLPPHRMILRQEMARVLLVLPLIFEQGLKCREIYNSGIMEAGEPLPCFSSKGLGEYPHLDIIVIYLFEVLLV